MPSSSRGGPGSLNPQVAVRIATLGGVVIAMLVVLLLRLWFLQVIGSEAYASQADGNRLRTVITEAPRGEIVDREGRVLVGNRIAQSVVARPLELREPRREEVIGQLVRAFRRSDPPIEATAAELLGLLEAGDKTPYRSVVLAEDIPPALEAYLAERPRQYAGVTLRPSFRRTYPEGPVAAHVLGYTGPLKEDEADQYRRRGYQLTDEIGRDGVERQYEEWLRGVPGSATVAVDAAGDPIDRGVVASVPPRPGNRLELSIDLDLQLVLEDQLRQQTELNNGTGAAGVAMDTRTGEILGLGSYPSFDPEIFVLDRPRERAALLNDTVRLPLFDRAISGRYPPGSTFKAVTATAALEEGKITPDELRDSPSEVVIAETPFGNFRGVSHGLVNLAQALEVSSDTYFYPIGEEFFEETDSPLQEWARAFGLGSPTRIDLSGEDAGLVPTPAWKRRAFAGPEFTFLDREWKPGDTVNVTVGQGNLIVTPLQMAVAFAAIANGGTVLTPSVGKRVLDAGDRQLAALAAGRPREPLGADPATLEAVRDGLYRVANFGNGTATGVFGGFPEGKKVAGKTGTAEQVGGDDQAWFIGYAPADDPDIVVAVMIERGGIGVQAAAPAACQVLAAHLVLPSETCGTPPPEELD